MISRLADRLSILHFAGCFRLRLLALALFVGFSVLALWRYGWSANALVVMIFSWLLLLFALIDLEQRLVPDPLLLTALPMVFLLNQLVQQPSPLSSLLGGFVGLLFLSLLHHVRPEGMGRGDIKLGGLIGLMVGFPGVVFALLLGMIAGGVAALVLIHQGHHRLQTMAYAPYLAIGACVILYGF